MGKPFGSALEVKQLATPSANPASGSTLLYPKSDGLWYTKSPAGVEAAVGGTAANMLTTDTVQAVTGAKTFGVGKLLMSNGVITNAEPYSDANPPETLMRTLWPAASVTTPSAGVATEFTIDGRSLNLKHSDGSVNRVGFTTAMAATTAAITLSGTQTIDGIAVVVGDRVLVKNQASAATNGVYDVQASTWSRTPGLDTATGAANSDIITVTGGTTNGGTVWTTSFKGTDTLNTTAMNWFRLVDASQVATGSTIMPPPLISRRTTTVANSTTTYATTGLSVTVAASKVYHFRARGQYQTAATTTGIGFRVGGTATATAISAEAFVTNVTASIQISTRSISSMSQAVTATSNVVAATTMYPWWVEGEIRVNAGGTLQIDFVSGAASAATLQTDCTLIVQEIP